MKRGFLLVFLLCLVGCLFGCENKETNQEVYAGMQSIETMKYDEALTVFEELILSGETTKEVYRGQGIAYIGKTMYEEAITSFISALKTSKGGITDIDIDINYYLATAYYKKGDFTDAINVYSAILALQPKESMAYFLRGKSEVKAGELEAAKADFDAYILFDSKNVAHYISINQSFLDADLKEEGKVYLNQALTNISSLNDTEKGTIYYYLEEYDLAKEYLETGKNTDSMEASLVLGKTYEALGAETYAASVYAKYLEKDPTSAIIYNQLALCKMHEEEYEEALSQLKKGYQYADPEFLQIMKFNEIVINEFAGDFTSAKAIAAAYVKTYPGDKIASREYEFLKSR